MTKFIVKQKNENWVFGVKANNKFVPLTEKNYSTAGNARRALKMFLHKESNNLNSLPAGRPSKKSRD